MQLYIFIFKFSYMRKELQISEAILRYAGRGRTAALVKMHKLTPQKIDYVCADHTKKYSIPK